MLPELSSATYYSVLQPIGRLQAYELRSRSRFLLPKWWAPAHTNDLSSETAFRRSNCRGKPAVQQWIMYDNPLLTALFDEKSSIPSSRLVQVRNLLNSHNRFIIVVPITPALIPVNAETLYQDTYLLSHIVQLESGKNDYRQPFTAPTLMTGWTLSFTEKQVAGVRGFPSTDPINITHTYTWNPGVHYISPEHIFLIVQISGLLVPESSSSRFDFFRRVDVSPHQELQDKLVDSDQDESGSLIGDQYSISSAEDAVSIRTNASEGSRSLSPPLEDVKEQQEQAATTSGETKDLEQLIGNKKVRRSKASAILGPLLQGFDIEAYTSAQELSAKFRLLVNKAQLELVSLGVNAPDAVHEYFEYQFGQRIRAHLLNNIARPTRPLPMIHERLNRLDVRQVGLPPDTDWVASDALATRAASMLEKLAEAITSADISAIMMDVVSGLGRGSGGMPTSADSLLGLLTLAILRSPEELPLDNLVQYVRLFSAPSSNLEGGSMGYVQLTFESVFVHLEESYDELAKMSDANVVFWNAVTSMTGNSKPQNKDDLPSLRKATAAAVNTGQSVLLSRFQGSSVLFRAVEGERPDWLRFLMTSYPEVFSVRNVLSERNARHATLLMAALELESRDCFELILELVVSHLDEKQQIRYFTLSDDQKRTIAHIVHHKDSLITSLGHLLDWTSRDARGMSPLMTLSCAYDHPHYNHMLTLALTKWSHNAHVSLYDHFDRKGNSILHLINPTSGELVRKLFEMPDVDVNWLNDKGQSALMIAARYDRKLLLTRLLEAGGNIWQRDNSGLTVFDLSKGSSTRLLYEHCEKFRRGPHALKTSIINNMCFFTISDDSSHITHRSMDDLVALRLLLQNTYPASWVPPIAADPHVLLDPWKTYRISGKLIGYAVDFFLRLLTSHATFKETEELSAFLANEDWAPPKLGKGKQYMRQHMRQKRQNIDGSECFTYLEPEIRSIETFFRHSIQHLKSFHVLYIQLSTAHRRLLNTREAGRQLLEYMYKLAVGFDNEELACTLPEMMSRSRHPGTTIQVPQNVYLVSQARTIASLMEALDRPVKLISQLRAADDVLVADRRKLKELGSAKSWPLAYFEDKRVKAIQNTEASIFNTKAKIERLTGSIAVSHDVLATELASFHKFQGEELLSMIKTYSEEVIQNHKDILSRSRRALNKLRLQRGDVEV